MIGKNYPYLHTHYIKLTKIHDFPKLRSLPAGVFNAMNMEIPTSILGYLNVREMIIFPGLNLMCGGLWHRAALHHLTGMRNWPLLTRHSGDELKQLFVVSKINGIGKTAFDAAYILKIKLLIYCVVSIFINSSGERNRMVGLRVSIFRISFVLIIPLFSRLLRVVVETQSPDSFSCTLIGLN